MSEELKSEIVSNQVFVGLPWKNVRDKYENVCDRLRISYPIFFKTIGRDDKQDAKDLLDSIKIAIRASSYSIFDATDGNANVSLEFGYAEAREVPKVLYISTRKKLGSGKEQAIISDLAGKTHHSYKSEKSLTALLRKFCSEHPFTKLFEKGFTKAFGRKNKGERRRLRALALKIIHTLDDKDLVRREDIVQALRADQSAYSEAEIDRVIKALHAGGLIVSQRGRYSQIWIK